MSDSSWLGGADGDRAVSVAGRALSYGELRERVQNHSLPPGPIVRAEHSDPVELLVRLLAGIDQGRPVLVADPASPAPLPRAVPAGTELLLLSSGSSGRARAIARTAASWHDSFAPLTAATGIRRTDVVAPSGPLHVSMHLFAALHALWLGAELSFDPAGADVVHCTPTVLGRLLSSPRLPRLFVVAGAALPSGARAEALSRGAAVTEYYGAAELSFVAVADAGGALRAFPGTELALRGGVLWARSPYISLGYAAGDGADTGSLRRDADGFASVGDLAELGAGGELRVLGRGDDAVTTAGGTVTSEQIESALDALPGVRAAAVIAEPHPVLGEIVVAVVELESAAERELENDADAGALPRSVQARADAALSPVERPRRWLFVEQLPRTASGKLAKGALRQGLADGTIPFTEHGAPRNAH
ncbi:class I adenylate-forming enzyme family protein [Microterricola pindariensis]|uniref:AMP-binding enzyme C-terminal domain-containing protein n=1 Tax=Microterricola pindariensis TaxID=478010 RepID=A0ABX5AVV7_9MICO|nr:class I adenylate-forming enzyme family protein [Microterricola pindariensis]PPL18970.1 hypothetical protein GY24_08375 [Microterricola pindariensis]